MLNVPPSHIVNSVMGSTGVLIGAAAFLLVLGFFSYGCILQFQLVPRGSSRAACPPPLITYVRGDDHAAVDKRCPNLPG